MKYVPGGTLKDLMAQGPLDPRQTAQLLHQIAEALAREFAVPGPQARAAAVSFVKELMVRRFLVLRVEPRPPAA